jgi:hypothetical protein
MTIRPSGLRQWDKPTVEIEMEAADHIRSLHHQGRINRFEAVGRLMIACRSLTVVNADRFLRCLPLEDAS